MSAPKHADSPLIGSLGDILSKALSAYESGDLVQTEEILRQVLDAMPDVATAWHLRGLAVQRSGALDLAANYLGEAQKRAPENPDYNRDLGAVLVALDRIPNARAMLDRAAALNADDPAVRFHLANVQSHQDEFSAAIENYLFCIERQPNAPDVYANLSAAYRSTGRIADAIASAQKAIALRAKFPEALNNLGLALCDARDYPAAIKAFGRALDLDPGDAEILNNFGVALEADQRLDGARSALEKAVGARPGWPEALINLGNVLREQGNVSEAVDRYQEAVDYDPTNSRALANLGLALLNLNRFAESEQTYSKALAGDPDNADVQMSLGICQLAQGNYREGWENYETRWQASAFTAHRRNFDAPRWTGEPLTGKRILVYAEQGFGDTLQFCRYLPLLAESGAEVHFECQRALADLCRSIDGVESVIARKDALPQSDYCIPLLSLPHVLGTTFDNVPTGIPYLEADPQKTLAFRKRYKGAGPLVGLVWLGNPNRQDDAIRSCPIDALRPILSVNGVQFASLQVGISHEDIPAGLEDLGSDFTNFADTAAAVEALDLVITVDTATAHLAGALGKPVWVMLGHHADWRYLADRADSPWYPTMHLFRQATPDDWLGLAQTVAQQLQACVDVGSEFNA